MRIAYEECTSPFSLETATPIYHALSHTKYVLAAAKRAGRPLRGGRTPAVLPGGPCGGLQCRKGYSLCCSGQTRAFILSCKWCSYSVEYPPLAIISQGIPPSDDYLSSHPGLPFLSPLFGGNLVVSTPEHGTKLITSTDPATTTTTSP
ncbi:unnamed protein product [Ectocarpus fasciculatus]